MTRRVAPAAAALRASSRRWYVTAASVRERIDGRGVTVRPASLAHAKEMGTLTTACGMWAYSWRKMLDLPFPVPPGAAPEVDMCGDCLARVSREW